MQRLAGRSTLTERPREAAVGNKLAQSLVRTDAPTSAAFAGLTNGTPYRLRQLELEIPE